MLETVSTLDEYLSAYGSMLGSQAAKALDPLHVPGQHPPAELNHGLLKRKPFEAQAHVVTALVKALRRQKSLLLVAEMGTGKTLMGMAAVHAHAGGKPYNALIFCPGQLCNKWERELQQTIPGVTVRQIQSWRDLVGIDRSHKPAGPTWWIIARDRAKLGAKWRAAYQRKRTSEGTIVACPSCYRPVVDPNGILVPEAELHKKRMVCSNDTCKSPLWTMTGEIKRYEPARLIHKKLRGFFKYLILDEIHEEKSADTAQGHACGSLAAACDKVIALTGTLIGGYAEHIRPLLFRLSPATVVAEDLGWNESMRFSELYGRIETKITERSGGSAQDNRQSRGSSSRSKTRYVRPGIMPSLFGRHLMDKAVFLSLGEVAANLPELTETVIPVEMDEELAPCYKRVESDLMAHIKQMVRRGDRRLLGVMLQTLLAYPDHPYGWEGVGYYERGEGGGKGNYITVTRPENLARKTIRPKESRLIELLRHEVSYGRQCWVYIQMTDKRDVASRLEEMIQRSGLRATVLRASVPLGDREAWVAENGRKADVVISHPRLVETGLDLFDKSGNHNFPTLIFYEMGYNPFTLRQASRRSWRIGQQERCKVIYMYYSGTLQERAMSLMGKKIAAAQAIDGKFSSEGLAAMAGDDSGSVEMALARSLADQINEGDASREWGKVSDIVRNETPIAIGALIGKAGGDVFDWFSSIELGTLGQQVQ